jgi:hypothetical protein
LAVVPRRTVVHLLGHEVFTIVGGCVVQGNAEIVSRGPQAVGLNEGGKSLIRGDRSVK